MRAATSVANKYIHTYMTNEMPSVIFALYMVRLFEHGHFKSSIGKGENVLVHHGAHTYSLGCRYEDYECQEEEKNERRVSQKRRLGLSKRNGKRKLRVGKTKSFQARGQR